VQLGFAAIILLFALFIGFEVYITIWPVASAYIADQLIDHVKRQIFVRTFLFLIPTMLVIIGFAIVISHRVVGPLYRIQHCIDDVVQGKNVPNLRLRKKDDPEIKNLANKINDLFAMIDELRKSTVTSNRSA
jgi:nitrogen fixation/metabolism regulation signal transduction histidine kinase